MRTRVMAFAAVLSIAIGLGMGCASADVSQQVEQARAELALRQALPAPGLSPQEVVQFQMSAFQRDSASHRSLRTAQFREDSIKAVFDSLLTLRNQLRRNQRGLSTQTTQGEDLPPQTAGGGVEATPARNTPGDRPRDATEEYRRVDRELAAVIHLKDNGPSFSHVGDGVKQAYQFLTPTLRYQMGPPRQWRSVVESETYRALVLHDSVRYAPPLVRGDRAMQRVVLKMPDGGETAYIFKLRRVSDEEHQVCMAGCWMTAQIIQEYPVEYGPVDGPKAAGPAAR